MIDPESILYLQKTAEQELQDVRKGKKPAALGFWKDIPSDIFCAELLPVPGRYYKYAIANSTERLADLMYSYYMPISAHADACLGKSLGYSDTAIENYVSQRKYKKKNISKLKHIYLKITTTAYKLGWKAVFSAFMGLVFRNKFVINILKKEGIL